jgi:hypothetical protein
MTDAELIAAHDAAYKRARGCPVYAPPQSVDAGIALRHATRSGTTSAACGDEWMRLHAQMMSRGLVSASNPHLFRRRLRARKGGA